MTATVAFKARYHEHLPAQFAGVPTAQQVFDSNRVLAAETALRNGTFQGAFLSLATRALGLYALLMSGFGAPQLDNAAVFPDAGWKLIFLANLGWKALAGNRPQGPRSVFEETACIVLSCYVQRSATKQPVNTKPRTVTRSTWRDRLHASQPKLVVGSHTSTARTPVLVTAW
ncbi:hypothetical protein [Hydrogenophaga sp.]|uniref:hypothetical protein n=1 Tax=Hydrogenophaga sp. TaxID=1904254 RepID=UPI0035679BB1